MLVQSVQHTEKETACYTLVTNYLVANTEVIDKELKTTGHKDQVGVINKMVLDSFTNCNSTITPSQARYVNTRENPTAFKSLVEIDIKAYSKMKVDPNMDFITTFRAIESSVEHYKNADL